MRFEPTQVTREVNGEAPSIRVEANRPYVLLATVFLLAILILPIVFQNRVPLVVVIVVISCWLSEGSGSSS